MNARDLLDRLAGISVETWSYKAPGGNPVRHIGPMAQDFHAAFNFGCDDKHISPIDANGVSLAAIQGLYQIVQEKDCTITAQQRRIDRLQQQLAQLEAVFAAQQRLSARMLSRLAALETKAEKGVGSRFRLSGRIGDTIGGD